MKQVLKNFFSSSVQKNAAKKLRQLIDVEQRFLLEDFSPEYLEEELGLHRDIVMKLVTDVYGQSFYELLRHLRITYLKNLVAKYGDKLGLIDYTKFTGFKSVKVMLHALKEETGLDFDDFCKYSANFISKDNT